MGCLWQLIVCRPGAQRARADRGSGAARKARRAYGILKSAPYRWMGDEQRQRTAGLFSVWGRMSYTVRVTFSTHPLRVLNVRDEIDNVVIRPALPDPRPHRR